MVFRRIGKGAAEHTPPTDGPASEQNFPCDFTCEDSGLAVLSRT